MRGVVGAASCWARCRGLLGQRPAGRRGSALGRHRRRGRRLPGLGGGLADLMSDELPDSPTTAETTSASVDNLLLVANGDSDVAFSLGDSAIDAVEGKRASASRSPLRALATIYPNISQVVVKADSGIETSRTWGKTVSVGSPESGTEVIALRLLEVAGLDRRRTSQARSSAWGSPCRRCATARSTGSSGRAACRPARSPTSRPPTTCACSRSTAISRHARALRRGLRGGGGRGGRVRGRRGDATIGVPNC